MLLATSVGSLDVDTLLLGIVWYVVLLFSLTFHEAGHAWAALRGGDRTAYRGGQVSLDPIPHIRREPFGTVIFPLLAYSLGGWMIGWASTPYDPAWAHAHPRRAGWMSLAGPASNLLLVLVAALFVPESTGQRLQEWMAQPGLAFGGILVAWLLIPRIFAPVHLWALHWLHPGSLYQ